MTGPAHLRFSPPLPAKTSSHPQCASPKSFVMTTLPITPTRSRTCGRKSRKFLKNDDFTKKGGGGTPTPLSDVIQPPAPLQPHAVEQTVQGEIAGVNVRGIVDPLDTNGRVLDFKTASKRPNGLSADHRLQLTTYAMITPGASGVCRLDTVTKTKTVQVIHGVIRSVPKTGALPKLCTPWCRSPFGMGFTRPTAAIRCVLVGTAATGASASTSSAAE